MGLIVIWGAGCSLGATNAAPSSPVLSGEKAPTGNSESLDDLLGEKPAVTPQKPAGTPEKPAEMVLPGIGLPIRYELAKPGKVSLNIYDETGNVVRELLRVAQREAGAHLELWDGLDSQRNPLPAGRYSWKLLSTPGLKAEYLLSVGTNYAIKPKAGWNQLAPGSIASPTYVYADPTGIYVGGASENIEPALIKQSLDGKTRLWERGLGPYNAPTGQAQIGEVLWMFVSGLKSILPIDPQTGGNVKDVKAIPTTWKVDKVESRGDWMAPCGRLLAVAYTKLNAIRWFDPAKGEVIAVTPMENPTTLAGSDNVLYASDGKTVLKFVGEASPPTVLITGLQSVRCMTVDAASGDLLLFDGGQYGGGDAQVKRYSQDGKFLRAYGPPGGRKDGLYTRETQEAFRATASLATLPDGGFVVAEPWSAPRRVAVFDRDGRWQREWYGGQMWAPWIFPEPDNPNAVWMASDWNGCMRLLVDYDAKTWKVHSTYSYGSTPFSIGNVGIGTGLQGAAVRNGELYLYRNGLLRKVDRQAGIWKAAALITGDLRHEVNIHFNLLPPAIQEAVKAHRTRKFNNQGYALAALRWTDANDDGKLQSPEATWQLFKGSYPHNVRGPILGWWTDGNGDGEVQEEELKNLPPDMPAGGTSMDGQFNFFFFNAKTRQLGVQSPTGWSDGGVPLYDGPSQTLDCAGMPESLANNVNQNFMTRDDRTGDFYMAANNPRGWGTSSASSMIKFGPDGSFRWSAGSAGSGPGQIRNFRGIFGVVKDCVVAPNTSYEWPQENLPLTYVWDKDGLYAGGLLDNPVVNDSIPVWRYALGAESIFGRVWENPASGEVLFFGHWVNEGRIYRITGWDGWERFEGNLELTETPGKGGNGLTASLLNADGQVVEQWLSPQAAFDSAKDLKSPASRQLAQKGPFSVRFFGKLKPPADGDYQFSVKAPGRVRLLLDGRVVIDSAFAEDLKHLALNPIPLLAKQSPWIQLEVWPLPGKPAQVSLQWSRAEAVAEPVPALALFAVPNPNAVPFGEGIGLSATYYRRVILPQDLASPTASHGETDKVQIDPEVNSTDKEFSVIWKGYFQPRNTGWTRLRGGGDFVMRLKILDRVAHEHYVYLEAGKKYPIAAYARAWTDVHNSKYLFEIKASRWTAPNTTNENLASIPQSQLFPETNAP